MFIKCVSVTLDLKVRMHVSSTRQPAFCGSGWTSAADSEAEVRVQGACQAVLLGSLPAWDQREQGRAQGVVGPLAVSQALFISWGAGGLCLMLYTCSELECGLGPC